MSALTPVPTYTFQQRVNPDAMHTGQKSDNPLLHSGLPISRLTSGETVTLTMTMTICDS